MNEQKDPAPETDEEAQAAENQEETSDELAEILDFPEAAADAAETLEEILADAERLANLEQENVQLKDQLLRALAETENLRRRSRREKEDATRYAVTGFARDLLAAADNMDRALESIPEGARDNDESLNNIAVGVEMTARELTTVFERNGIQRVEAAGQPFDHNLHQAMFEVPDPSVPAGTVVQVLQGGYTLHDRLLRPAMVGVAKGGPKAEKAPAATDESTPAPAADAYDKPAADAGGTVDTET